MDGANELHLVIPSCTAHQLVNKHRIPLTTGPLTLSTNHLSPGAPLLLHVSPITLPLSAEETIARTHPDRPNTYLFGTSSGIIELTIDVSAPEVDALVTQFETLLVEYNLLTTGLVADADDITGFLEAAAAKISAGAANIAEKQLNKPPGPERSVPPSVKTVANAAAASTGAVASVTGQFADTVKSTAEAVGGWVASKVGTNEEVKETVTAAELVGEGAKDTTGEVRTRLGDDVAEVVQHDHGKEVREVVDKTRDTTGHIGQIMGDVTAIPSKVIWEAGAAAMGAGKVEERAVKSTAE